MARYLILAQSDVAARALGVWLEFLSEPPLELGDQGKLKDSRCIVWQELEGGDSEKGILVYEHLVRQIEQAARFEDGAILLNEVTMVVDSIRPARLNPLQDGYSWDGTVAMLILTFPEIRWVFGVVGDTDLASGLRAGLHGLISLLTDPRRDPLFDPTGLRECVRRNARLANGGADCGYLPERKHAAAAMDEEKAYAYFHGYTAYRFGYLTDVVSSWSLADYLFGRARKEAMTAERESDKKVASSPGLHGYRLLIEDMSLNFADRKSGTHLLRLASYSPSGTSVVNQGRAYHLPILNSSDPREESHLRLLVTTGQGSSHYSSALAENRKYLKKEKKKGSGRVIFKPAGGMLKFWDDARLLKRDAGGRRLGDAPGFVWPPRQTQNGDNEADIGHGAPGRMTLVAETLLRRANAIQIADTSVLENIQGAVLATDALELLGGRTPTLAAEALTLKHLLELQAECHFGGVEFHFEMKPRLVELEMEASAIAQAFQRGQQENARLNILMQAANRIVNLLREQNQFDEEQFWMNRARHWHNTLWMREHPWRQLFWPILRYAEFVLKSFLCFAVALAAWIIILTALYAVTSNLGVTGALKASLSSFIGVQPPDADLHANFGVAALAMIAGATHIGIFISYIYTLVSRK